MRPLWLLPVLLLVLLLLTLHAFPLGRTAQPCLTITATVHRDIPVTIPISFTKTMFVLQKYDGTDWQSLAICMESKCKKLSQNVTADITLRDGELELSKVSAGAYRARRCLDETCLANITLREPTSAPFPTNSASPETTKSMGWAALLCLVALLVRVICPCFTCAGGIQGFQQGPKLFRHLRKRTKNWIFWRRSPSGAEASTCSLASQPLPSPV